MTPQNLPADWQERQRALDIEQSFCVLAPAGSGKTELLTQRLLRLLAHAAQPEEILAITFTRKAAAEMRKRLLGTLLKARQSLDEDEFSQLPSHEKLSRELANAVLRQDGDLDWRLLQNPQRLRIMTIDSFNAYLTAQHPILSDFGAPPQIGDDIDECYEEAVKALFKNLDNEGALGDDLAALLVHLNNNLSGVKTLLVDLLGKREQWLPHLIQISQDPEHARDFLERELALLIEENLQHLSRLLLPYQQTVLDLLNFAAQQLEAQGLASTFSAWAGLASWSEQLDAGRIGDWKALSDFFLTGTGDWRKTVTKKNGFPAPSSASNADDKTRYQIQKEVFMNLVESLSAHPEILELLNLMREMPQPSYSDDQWQLLDALTRILPRLVAELTVILREHSLSDYIQVSHAALNALGDEDGATDLALKLDYRIRHILVDEFQDTSTMQVRLLEKLTANWQSGDGRSLFIVGDGMQSCYGFRNANVGLFLAARQNGIGSVPLIPLDLTVNFRSQAAVVDWVNQIFSKAFPRESDIGRGAVSYNPSQAMAGTQAPHSGVEILLTVIDKDQNIDPRSRRMAEARNLVSLIQAQQARDPEQSIAVLVRTRSHLEEIVQALREAGVPWLASDIDALTAYPEVEDLLSLSKALLNPADKTAWFALLRSPFLGLAMSDIHLLALAAIQQQRSLWGVIQDCSRLEEISDHGRRRLQACLPVLLRARRLRRRLPLRDWLTETWIGLGGPAALDPHSSPENLSAFFDLLEKYDEQGDIRDIHQFEERLARVYAKGVQDSAIKLHIMTIHKAKGLEFDLVFLPCLERIPQGDDNPLLLWKEHISPAGQHGLMISLLARKGEPQDSVYHYLKCEARRRSDMENTRLLYIGVTRAARKAYLLACVSKDKDKGILAPASRSLLATIWPALDEDGVQANLTLQELAAGERTETPPIEHPALLSRRLPAGWTYPGLAQWPEEEAPEAEELDERHRLLDKTTGELIHQSLQALCEQGLENFSAASLESRHAAWALQLRPHCRHDEEVGQRIQAIQGNLLNCIEDDRGRWLLDANWRDAACELSISDYSQGYRKEFVVDRTFIDEHGTRWIIDYKSAGLREGEDLEVFGRRQAGLYHAQLENYARLFLAMEERPVVTALYFTALPHLWEVAKYSP